MFWKRKLSVIMKFTTKQNKQKKKEKCRLKKMLLHEMDYMSYGFKNQTKIYNKIGQFLSQKNLDKKVWSISV